MRSILIGLCLLGALSANAGPMCPDSYPMECQRLCTTLRRDIPRTERVSVWLWLWMQGDFKGGGCDTDARSWHTAAECTYAADWIARWDHDGVCFHYWTECYRQTAQCMFEHPYWDGCFCGHPGDGC